MKDIRLFKSVECCNLKVAVVDIAALKIDKSGNETGCHENRLREKLATQEAVDRMFNKRVEIKHAPDGHPYIDNLDGTLTISHARNVLVAIYSPDRVIGVDIEFPREALARVASKFLSNNEMGYAVDIDNLLRAWTIKEAVYKAMLQKGLSLYSIKLPDLAKKEPRAVVETIEGQAFFRLYYDRISEGMITLAVRDDAECRDTDFS